MKVITEERLKVLHKQLLSSKYFDGREAEIDIISSLLYECQELDTLTGENDLDLILAAEKYAENYDGDERQDIKTDVLNAYYHGAYWNKKHLLGVFTPVRRYEPEKV